jgi:integrase
VWALQISSGLRSAEARGLIWDEVDWERRGIAVRRQIGREAGGWTRGPLIASREHEFLALPEFAMAALQRHRLKMADARKPDWTHHGHVVVTPKGRPPYDWQLLKALGEACERLKLPVVKVHELRHTSLTILQGEGVDEATRMRRAGQSTVAMARRYAHGSDELDRDAADALQRAVGG